MQMATKAVKKNTKKQESIPEASDIPVYCAFDKIVNKNTLKVHPRNPNKHPEHQILLLAKIILKNGWRNPVVVSNRSGLVTKGHGRLLAAQKLEVADVPVDYQDYESEEMELADVVADNRISELSEMDRPILKDIISDLDTGAFDLGLIGYDMDSLEELMTAAPPAGLGDLKFEGEGEGVGEPGDKDINEAEPQVEIAEELKKKWKTELGQIWQLGDHRLMCGDSTSKKDVDILMDGNKADIVFTDPPYNVDYGNIKHSKFKSRSIENDNMSGSDFSVFCNSFIDRLVENCDGCFYVWAGPGPDGRIMFSLLDKKLHCSTTIVWNKDQFTLGRGKYQNKWEPCWFGWSKDGKNFTDDRTLTNVWDFKRPRKSELHPTMKPIELIDNALKHASKCGDYVLDLFGGSGSTLIASEKTNRKCLMMELDPKYIAVILERFLDATGTEPKLLN
jgi:DNA modification methylase